MRRCLVSSLALLLFVPVAGAHPVPKTNRDRTIVVHVTARALVVDYRLELDEGSIPNELTKEELAGVTTRAELLERFTRSFADTTCRTLDASLDGQELPFKCVQHKYTASDHVRCEYRFEAPWNLTPNVEHKLKFHETNYITDDFSRLCLYLAADDSVRFLSAKAPSEELMSRSSDERKPGDGNRLRRAEAQFLLAEDVPRAVSKPAFPPDSLIGKSEPDGPVSDGKASATPVETLSKTAPAKAAPETTGESSIVEPGSFWERITHPNVLMNLLLDSREGLVVLLLLAAVAGAAHALTPGHGKTLVAAYLVGERGTVWHAILLGLVTTFTHTGAVMVLAGVLALLPGLGSAVFALQGLIGGFLIMGLGLWLLYRRLAGQADHIHLGGGHHYHHHGDGHHHPHAPEALSKSAIQAEPGHLHEHQHEDPHGEFDHVHDEHGAIVLTRPRKARVWEVITLGMVGGMLPCVDAVVLLGLAVSAGRTRLALPLLVAFSAGLASVLVMLGLAVVGAKRLVQQAAPSNRWLEKVARPLPILSAVVVILLGLLLCYRSLNP